MKNRDYFIIQNVAAILVGMLLVMLLHSAVTYLLVTIVAVFFINFLMCIIGLAVIMAGANMLVDLNVASRWSMVSGYFYITPILIILAGMLVLVNPFTVATIPFIVLGISCMVYGIVNMINTIKFKKDPDKYEY